MKTTAERDPSRPGRRRALGLIAGLGALGFALPWPRRAAEIPPAQPVLSLREAEFYRPHDLAG